MKQRKAAIRYRKAIEELNNSDRRVVRNTIIDALNARATIKIKLEDTLDSMTRADQHPEVRADLT